MVECKGKTEWTAKELEQIDSYSILSIIVEVLKIKQNREGNNLVQTQDLWKKEFNEVSTIKALFGNEIRYVDGNVQKLQDQSKNNLKK